MSMTAVPSEPRQRTASEPMSPLDGAETIGAASPVARHTHPRGNRRHPRTGICARPLSHSFAVPAKDPAAVPRSRRLLLSAVRAWEVPLVDETLYDLALLSGEVIANAVLHTSGPCSVTVSWTGTRLRVEVADTADRLPTQRARELYAESGRGLTLVASLAASWGSAGTATGKVIWFEVAPAASALDVDRPAGLVIPATA